MASVNKTGLLTFNGVTYTSYVQGVMDDSADVTRQDATVWGSGAKVFAPGLAENRLRVRLLHDAANVDATLHAAAQAGTTGALAWRYSSDAIAAGNPEYQASAFIASYRRNAGEVDGLQTCEVEFALTTSITRDITP